MRSKIFHAGTEAPNDLMSLEQASRDFLSPIFSNKVEASINIPFLSPGDASSCGGKYLQAMYRARACSLSPATTNFLSSINTETFQR